jgi:transposase
MPKKGCLTEQEEKELKMMHRKEQGKKIADRIKVVLLTNEGWNYLQISRALFINEDTARIHFKEYIDSKKLIINSGGSKSKLSDEDSKSLALHLEANIYAKIADICEYVWQKYNVRYSISGMRKWLQNNGFSYRKPEPIPAKADPVQQKEYIEQYKKDKENMSKDEIVLFMDAVHPTMSTKISYGWIKKNSNTKIKTAPSNTRMNILGAIELNSMKLITRSYKTINSEAAVDFLDVVTNYYQGLKIRIIMDNGKYNKSKATRKGAEELNIELRYLPTYSPNLNPIERVWKIMNECTRNNRFFSTFAEFRDSINNFFAHTWKNISELMRTRVTDKFQLFT